MLIDHNFWKIEKHKSFKKYNLYLLRRDDFYYVLVDDKKDNPILGYSSFSRQYAMNKFNEYKRNLMIKNEVWL